MVENMDARTFAFEQPFKGHTVISVGEILGFHGFFLIAKSIFVPFLKSSHRPKKFKKSCVALFR